MEEALECVVEELDGPDGAAEALDGAHERLDDVRRGLEYVRPHVVEQMGERVLAAEAVDAHGHVADGGHGRLAMHQVAVHERVLEERRHRVYVVLAHLADVLEHERERLEHAVLHVELGHAVLVHETGQDGEGRARLGHDGDRDRGAHAVLTLLDLEVIE